MTFILCMILLLALIMLIKSENRANQFARPCSVNQFARPCLANRDNSGEHITLRNPIPVSELDYAAYEITL